MMKRIDRVAAALTLVGALAIPASAADVHVGINVGVPAPPSIVFVSPPRLVVVPEAPQVLYAPDVQVSFFSYGDRYYSTNGGNWFVADEDRGPWTYVDRGRVPRQVLLVPTRYHSGGHGHDNGHHKGRGHHKNANHKGKHKDGHHDGRHDD